LAFIVVALAVVAFVLELVMLFVLWAAAAVTAKTAHRLAILTTFVRFTAVILQ
jgi:hypothetical protein